MNPWQLQIQAQQQSKSHGLPSLSLYGGVNKANATLNASVQYKRFVVVLLARVHVVEHQEAADAYTISIMGIQHTNTTPTSTLLARGILQCLIFCLFSHACAVGKWSGRALLFCL
jgi:hypothetical protein